jgi:hypothetical protein
LQVPESKNYLVQEFNYQNGFLGKLGFYDDSGKLLWEVVKPRFHLKIAAVSSDQAAVFWQSGRVEDGNRVDQVKH